MGLFYSTNTNNVTITRGTMVSKPGDDNAIFVLCEDVQTPISSGARLYDANGYKYYLSHPNETDDFHNAKHIRKTQLLRIPKGTNIMTNDIPSVLEKDIMAKVEKVTFTHEFDILKKFSVDGRPEYIRFSGGGPWNMGHIPVEYYLSK